MKTAALIRGKDLFKIYEVYINKREVSYIKIYSDFNINEEDWSLTTGKYYKFGDWITRKVKVVALNEKELISFLDKKFHGYLNYDGWGLDEVINEYNYEITSIIELNPEQSFLYKHALDYDDRGDMEKLEIFEQGEK